MKPGEMYWCICSEFFSDPLTKLYDFILLEEKLIGPFGLLAVLLSLLIPLSIALFFSIAYKQKTSSLIKARENTKELESEFTNSIFCVRIMAPIILIVAFAVPSSCRCAI
jgi:hypothetical protein